MKIKRNIITLLAVLAILGTLLVTAAVPASAQDGYGFDLSTYCATVGASITVYAYFPADTILTADLDGVTMTTAPPVVKTDVDGYATFAVKIPAITAGYHDFTVSDGVNTITEEDFWVSPKVVVTDPAAKKGIVGSSVTVVGTGFTAGVTADVYFYDDIPVASDVPINSSGGFTVVGTVPNVDAGTYDVEAEDGAGFSTEDECGVGDTFTVLPTLTVTPVSGLAGSYVRLYGTGWCAEGEVEVYIAGEYYYTFDISPESVLDERNVQIPGDLSPGIKQIQVTCLGDAAITQTVNFTVVARPLSISPTSGPRGTEVLVTGTTMTQGGDATIDVCDLWISGDCWNTGDDPYPGVIDISSGGVITPTILPIPEWAPIGNNFIQAFDSEDLEADGVFIVKQPTISISPVTGPRGSTIVITGAGWLTDEAVTIEFTDALGDVIDDMDVIPVGNGTFAAGLTVPNVDEQGAYTIAAYDDWNNEAVPKTFTVPGPAITISPTSGGPTTPVEVKGTGFSRYNPVEFWIGDYDLPGQALPDASGAFTYTFNAPGLEPGVQVIWAENRIDQTANTFFTLTEAPVGIGTQLAGISSHLVRVWYFSGGTIGTIGTWTFYDPTDLAGSTLTTLTPGNGYWISVDQACTLVYGAYSYSLLPGWNNPGWR
jgi:hypothetical protein